MKRRGGKREGAGRKKSPALAKITRAINQKHWRANHHYIYLENRVFSTWRKVRAEGFPHRQASEQSRFSPRQGQPFVEPCFLRVEQALLQ